MMQNILTAGYKRSPSAFGIGDENYLPTWLDKKTNKVFTALQEERICTGSRIVTSPSILPNRSFPTEEKSKDETIAKNIRKKQEDIQKKQDIQKQE